MGKKRATHKSSEREATRLAIRFRWVAPPPDIEAAIQHVLVGYSRTPHGDFAMPGQMEKVTAGLQAREPKRWNLVLRRVVAHYRKETGDFGAIDWQKVLDWIIKYGPLILKLLIALFL